MTLTDNDRPRAVKSTAFESAIEIEDVDGRGLRYTTLETEGELADDNAVYGKRHER